MAVLSGYADVKPLTDRLLTALRAVLGERLVAMALYGSVARQVARPTSDIDLFLVHRGDRHAALCTFVEVEMGLRDDSLTARLRARGVPIKPMPVFRSEASLADTPWLLLDIAHHGIMLFDPRSVLARKLAYVYRPWERWVLDLTPVVDARRNDGNHQRSMPWLVLTIRSFRSD